MVADIILILIMLLCVFLGYKRGLIKVAVRILSFVIAIVIALVLYTPISNYIIDNTEVVPSLKTTIHSKLYNKENNQVEVEEDKGITEKIEDYVNKYTEEAVESSSEAIAQQLAIIIVRVGTWILLFVIAKVVMLVIKIFSDIIAEIPILKQFNKMRRNNLWDFRRICNYIYSPWNNKCSITNVWRKSNK